MLYFTKQETDCTGCGACAATCPVGCIAMVPDEEGFLYPSASDACIHCGKCARICPVGKETSTPNLLSKTAVAAVSKTHDTWRRSASGGAFSEICKVWGDDTTQIFGAAWDGFQVTHVGVTGVDNIAPLCKSKYVASTMGDSYQKVKQALLAGTKVIFCGTPCQVAGLNAYLNKEYDNLLTIDLICHGVGSPAVFQECIRVMEKQLGKKVAAYEFRAKRNVYDTDHLTKLTYIDGNGEEYFYGDPYIQLFLSQRALRASCSVPCGFRNENRPGDLTIADCKGLLTQFPQLEGTKRNYSTVVANTEKGLLVLKGLNRYMDVLETDLDAVKEHNPLYYRQTYFPQDREAFLADFRRDRATAVEKWTKPYEKSEPSVKHKVYDAAPVFVRKWAKRILDKRSKHE